MKRAFLYSAVITLVFVVPIWAADSISPTLQIPEPNIIDPNVAILAATDYLPSFYPGAWEYFNHITCYNLNGVPAAYAVIFRDPNSTIKTWDDLTAWLQKASDELGELDKQTKIIEASQETPENKEKLLKERNAEKTRALRQSYRSMDFATVMTGATETSPVLIRCYKGLPAFLVKKPVLEAELTANYSDLQLGRLLYFDPLDIRYEAVLKKAIQAGSKEVSDDSYTIALVKGKKDFRKIADERQKLKERTMVNEQNLAKWTNEDREKLGHSRKAAEQHNVSNWAEYKTKHQMQQSRQNKEGRK
jgi:hypothetical protein